MGEFDDDDFDVGDFFDIIIPLLTNILIVVLCFWLCFKCCKCRRNEGAVIATAPAVVITSSQHYPAAVATTGPNPVAAPTVFMPPNANASTAGYQQLQQQQQQKPATAPPLMDLASQDPPTYEEAVGAGQQPQFNPNYPRQ